MADRTASAAAPPAPLTPVPPKVDPVASEPPVTKANYESAGPLPPVLSTPMRDAEPGPTPPPPPAPLPIPSNPVGLAPPGGPLPPIPSATDGPIKGVQPPDRLPPAPPITPIR
jgi:hypothetical protein